MMMPSVKKLYITIRRDLSLSKQVFGDTDKKQFNQGQSQDATDEESCVEDIENVLPLAESQASSAMHVVFVPSGGDSGQYPAAIVKSHVAKLAAEKRRLEKEKQRRNSPPETLASSPSKPPRIRHRSSSDSSSSDSYCDQGDTVHPRRDGNSPSLVSSPTSMVQRGNSDPFNTMIVVLDASANELLSFNGDCFLPLVHSFERSQHKRASYLNKFYQGGLDAMHDECTANASLYRLAAVIANHLPKNEDRRIVVGKFAGQAYTSLREQLAKTDADSRDKLEGQIFALFSAETLAHNFEAAAMHIRTLQNLLFQDQREVRPIDPVLLQACSWKDLIRSMLSGTRPIFRLESFVDLSPNILNDLAARLIQLDLLQDGLLEESPEVPAALRPHLAKFRWLARICGACPLAPRLVTFEVNCSYADHATTTMCRVNCVYFDACDAIASGEDSDLLHLTAVAALAGAFWIWADSNFDFLDPGNTDWKIVYPSLSPAPRVLPELLQRIQRMDQNESPVSPSMRLWILYVASLAELAVHNFAGSKTPGWSNECHMNFVRQAVSMGLVMWEEVERDLSELLYHPRTRPDGREWFEKGLNELLQAPQNGEEPHLVLL